MADNVEHDQTFFPVVSDLDLLCLFRYVCLYLGF